MADFTMLVTGLTELRQRFQAFPDKFYEFVSKTLDYSLLTIQGEVPEYPAPPDNSDYIRTGTLGRTLGSGGKADIYEVKQQGPGLESASFGTKLEYAQYVIGDLQAWMHQTRWWRLGVEVLENALPKIEQAFKVMAEEMAKWLDGNK